MTQSSDERDDAPVQNTARVKRPRTKSVKTEQLALIQNNPADVPQPGGQADSPADKPKRKITPRKPRVSKNAVLAPKSEEVPAVEALVSDASGQTVGLEVPVRGAGSGAAKPIGRGRSHRGGRGRGGKRATTPNTEEPTIKPEDTPPSADSMVAVEAAVMAAPVQAAEEASFEGGRPGGRSRRGRSRRERRKPQAQAQAPDTEDSGEQLPTQADDYLEEIEENGQARDCGRGKKARGTAGREEELVRHKRKMFVSVLPGEQVEVVLTEEGQVQEYYVEMLHQAKIKGNIYKGIIHNVDPNLQAAFVSYGAAKNGFLQIDEVHPEYYLSPHDPNKSRKYPLIQKVLKPGQEVLVQVVKEPSGTKGAFLTSYISIPGRFLVLTPGREQIGVSRKVESEDERARLRELLSGLTPGPGLGVIVRTVSMGASKTSLQSDLRFLKRLWRDVRKKGTTEPAPSLIYQELDLAARAVRDYLTDEVQEIWIDDDKLGAQISEVVSLLFPRRSGLVQIHHDAGQTLFERFGLQKQLDQVHGREVYLQSGGRLVFDHTEALTAIDINSGRSGGKNNFEDMAYKINMEAAAAIPLQLRLRDIGGQVVVDFIEMRDRNHWRDVERIFRNGMKNDRARHDVGKISSFGLLEVVRQRLGSSAISISTEPCPLCKGTGQRRNMEWQAQYALREINRQVHQAKTQNQNQAVYSGGPELVLYLLNHKRERLLEIEKTAGLHLELKPTVS